MTLGLETNLRTTTVVSAVITTTMITVLKTIMMASMIHQIDQMIIHQVSSHSQSKQQASVTTPAMKNLIQMHLAGMKKITSAT